MIKPEESRILVERVVNGWVVSLPNYWRRSMESGGNIDIEANIARTPKELADMIAEWATRQQDVK